MSKIVLTEVPLESNVCDAERCALKPPSAHPDFRKISAIPPSYITN